MDDSVGRSIRTDIDRLCAPGDRALGTQRNRDATAYVMRRLADAGLDVSAVDFSVPEWRFGESHVRVGDVDMPLHAGPFSPAAHGAGPLVPIRSLEDVHEVSAPGAVLLLMGEIAQEQFTPRDYPFYSNPDHAAIVDALEAVQPLAVLAATGSSAMTGAMSPFPLIEEAGFGVPSAYMDEAAGERLASSAGSVVEVFIDSDARPSTGVQPLGRRRGASRGRIIVSAHVDSKPETPGAIDNAAGVAVMLVIADLLRNAVLGKALEFIPFNGEDHALAPGELAWLAADDLAGIELVINIDAAGLRGGPTAYSLYGVDECTRKAAAALAAAQPSVVEGPAWYASDHMIFAMRGIPAVAVTSSDFRTASRGYSHTPADTPDILDYELLEQSAYFIADLIRAVG